MAQLGSPGVQVNVIDESFYNPATPGTVPLVVIATAQDKANAAGTGIAPGTTATNAGSLYLATSQKDLTDRFGLPTFQKDASNNAIQGSELNEYGLFAAYSFLGASNSAYILRANVDLGSLVGKAVAPTGTPDEGTYWFDIANSRFGIFEWNATTQDFTNKTVRIINSGNDVISTSTNDANYAVPKASVGVIGEYAIVTLAETNILWYKNSDANWVKVGSKVTTTNVTYSGNAWAATDWASSWSTLRTIANPVVNTGEKFDITVGAGSPITFTVNLTTTAGLATELNTALSSTSVRVKLIGTDTIGFYSAKGETIVIEATTGAPAPASCLGLTKIGFVAGTYNAPGTQASSHTKVPFWRTTDVDPALGVLSNRPSGSVWIKTTEFDLGAKWSIKRYNADTRIFETKTAPIYTGTAAAIASLDTRGGGVNIPVGTIFVNEDYNQQGIVNFKIMARASAGSTTAATTVAPDRVLSSVTVNIAETVKGSDVLHVVSITTGTSIETLKAAINNSALVNVTAEYANGQFSLTHALGGEIFLDGALWASLGFDTTVDNVYTGPTGTAYELRVSKWKSLADYAVAGQYYPASSAPTSTPANNTLWYSSYQDQVDIMVHDGVIWKGLQQVYPGAQVIVGASKPSSSGRVIGDIWVDTSDSDLYGHNIKRWNPLAGWDPITTTDHTSQYGIIYADARWSTDGGTTLGGNSASTIDALANSDYVDFDAPDPASYPRGMLLWNTRRNGMNIKQYKVDYVPTTGKFTNAWVSVSGQDLNQVAYFGRKAQRSYVTGQMKAVLNTNQRILDEDNIFFNLISAPGYPELIPDMVNLNNSRNGTALVVGDTPLRLDSSANSLVNYGTDYYNSGIDGELGLHTNDDHLAVYYPAGLTTDLSGTNVVVPASHMMLRTIAISDQRSFQWFAPAGTRRGGVTNATSVGYLQNGSFIPVSLNQGTRDQMAQVKINPITNIPGAGLVAFGQHTRSGVNSSLDRINVSRLVSYLRRQLAIITKPFIFEPNDKQTRSEIKNVCESLLLDLVSLRGVYDFIVVCDETNNTSSVISNNQLYVDIAVEPVKAVEFIYIPLRLKNVGDIKSRQ